MANKLTYTSSLMKSSKFDETNKLNLVDKVSELFDFNEPNELTTEPAEVNKLNNERSEHNVGLILLLSSCAHFPWWTLKESDEV